jgi:hypothetical protein
MGEVHHHPFPSHPIVQTPFISTKAAKSFSMAPNASRNTKTITDQLTLDALNTLWERLDTLSDEDLVKLQVMLQGLARAVDFEISFRN